MKCEIAKTRLEAFADETLEAAELDAMRAHIRGCEDCRLALRGLEALAELRKRPVDPAPAGLFERVVERTVTAPTVPARTENRFWLGAGFGAIAASLLAVALFFGWASAPDPATTSAEFVVSLDEPRQMDIAFETDRALEGATITILLAGSVEIDGYGPRRELSWSENLDAGVNRLSLPVIANGFEGGQMVVRLEHPLSEQVFVVRLPVES